MRNAENLPNLRHLDGFLAVADSKSLSRAAQRINLSQPALTQAVAKLESRLGVPLFERRAAGMALTEPGMIFASRVRQGMAYLRRGAAMVAVGRGHRFGLVSLGQLRALIETVEAGGFAAGAAALERDVSTLNRACRELERLVGLPLFEATLSGVRATRQAEELSRLAKLALMEIRQAIYDVKGWQGEHEGRLVIGCLPLAQSALLPEALSRFALVYPRVAPAVVDGSYAGLARALRRGDLDLILGALRQDDLPDELVQTGLFSDPLAVVAHPEHSLAGRAAVTDALLAGYPWVAPRTGAPARDYFEALHARLDVPRGVPQVIETGSHAVMRGLLMASDRITLISAEQVKGDIGLGLLARIDVDLPGSERLIGFTAREGWVPSLPQMRFLEILRQVVAER